MKQVAAVGQAAAAKVRMPVQVRRVLERAITARLRCTEWFEAAHVESRRSNEGHMHFTRVLQNALDMLVWSSSSLDGNALVPPMEDGEENIVRDLQYVFVGCGGCETILTVNAETGSRCWMSRMWMTSLP